MFDESMFDSFLSLPLKKGAQAGNLLDVTRSEKRQGSIFKHAASAGRAGEQVAGGILATLLQKSCRVELSTDCLALLLVRHLINAGRGGTSLGKTEREK